MGIDCSTPFHLLFFMKSLRKARGAILCIDFSQIDNADQGAIGKIAEYVLACVSVLSLAVSFQTKSVNRSSTTSFLMILLLADHSNDQEIPSASIVVRSFTGFSGALAELITKTNAGNKTTKITMISFSAGVVSLQCKVSPTE